jgi:cytidylate kinase
MAATEALSSSEFTKSPEVLREFIKENPVFLISADLPGCGSTTLTRGIAENITAIYGVEPHVIQIGNALRETLGVTNEAELQARLKEINDPHAFDPQFYGDLPQDRPCIIDGKLATTVGPQYIDLNDRPVISIDLTSQPLVSAKRVLQREGQQFSDIFRVQDGGAALLGRLAMIERRSAHDMQMRGIVETEDGEDSNIDDGVMKYRIDTSNVSTTEVIEYFTGTANFAEHVPEWEFQALRETLATLAHLHIMLDGKVHPIDVTHFEHQFESIRYNMDRLGVMTHPIGIQEVRANLKKAITDCWFGLMMKEAPRFFSNADGETSIDSDSPKWTPEFYKIAEGWPILSTMLKDKEILDPFAGAGTLMNLLVARNVPKSAVLSDIAFIGGVPLDAEGHTYLPGLNTQISQLLFDNLPSWYKPDFTPIKGHVTASANKLPIKDNAVDYIVADPPYGKNCASGGIGLLIGSIREFNRVAREGSILMVPIEWMKEIEAAGYSVIQLTKDVSRGHSKLPVCYILIESDKES